MENSPIETHASSGNSILSPDILLGILTWVTFFIVFFILKKFAFKPILENLQKREKEIREALENADKAKLQLTHIEEEKQKILDAAKTQAAQIINQGRKTARDLAADIETKSRQHAQEITQGAHAQIAGEKQRLLKTLRQESAEIAISLAGKIIKENMDKDKNRRLVEEEVKQL
ncbi:MAG: F0F1 ATP synthase subunit B [Candidatus Omnitrophica bacterium]|nr:F0F1 ATP synthase subunit B [Candidatus Omnitrophota bacterium]